MTRSKLKSRSNLIQTHTAIIGDEIVREGRSWIASQKQAFYILLLAIGPSVIGLPFFVVKAFSEESSNSLLFVNLVLVTSISLSTDIFQATAKKFIHQAQSKYLPFKRFHWWAISCFFQIFSNAVFISCLAVSLVLGVVFAGNEININDLALKVSCYAAALLYASFVVSQFNWSSIFSFSYFFFFGFSILTINWILLTVLLIVSFGYQKYSFRISAVTQFNNSHLLVFLLKDSSFLWLVFLYLGSNLFYHGVSSDVDILYSAIGISSVLLFGHCLAKAVEFCKKQAGLCRHLPFGKKISINNLFTFTVLNVITQIGLYLATCLYFDKEFAIKLLSFQLIGMSLGVFFSFYKDDLRIPMQIIVFFIYLLSLF